MSSYSMRLSRPVPENLLILSLFEPKNTFLHCVSSSFSLRIVMGTFTGRILNSFSKYWGRSVLKDRKGSFKRNCFTGWHHYNRFVYNNTGGYLRKNQTPITTAEQKIREISALMLVPGSSDSPGLKSKARGSRSKRDLPGNRCYPNQLSHL